MGLTITDQQAEEIIEFYDRKQVGEMDYKVFLEHVCEDMDVFLTYTEETPRTINRKKKSMVKNPFVIKEFKALPNKTLGNLVELFFLFCLCLRNPPLTDAALWATSSPIISSNLPPSSHTYTEMFKRKVKSSLETKIKNDGGSVKSWVRDAFARWDPTFSGKVADWKFMQGACKRFGFTLSEDEARSIMHSYATDDSGAA